MNTTERTDNYPAATAIARQVEMIDTRGKRHMVAKITSRSGQDNWCSRKFIATRGTFSGSWLQVDILGWTLASMS
jgi:hypothetical protein